MLSQKPLAGDISRLTVRSWTDPEHPCGAGLPVGCSIPAVVTELSSFQLQRTDKLPAEVAVLLNVSPDHLDWHASEDEYRQAKYRIFREARAAVVNRLDPEAAEREAARESDEPAPERVAHEAVALRPAGQLAAEAIGDIRRLQVAAGDQVLERGD